jgi:serine/threonine-protein kinase RsbW
MMQKLFKIELESKVDSLPVIGDFIESTLTQFKADAGMIYKVQLAVDEACTNVINYAYAGGVGPIILSLELVGEEIIITVTDRGTPFDPTTVPPPDTSSDVDERKIGGLGIFFIRQIMDSVSYSFDPQVGNQLIFKKKILPVKSADVEHPAPTI